MGHPDDEFGARTSENLLNSILSRSYELHEDFEETRPEGIAFHGDELADLPLFDEEDILCLMHRDAHFSGSFAVMKEYYQNPDAKGAVEEITPARIALLEAVQDGLKRDLAPLLIRGPDAEKVALSRQVYKDLGELCHNDPSSPEGMLAAAILSEDDVDSIVETAPPALMERPETLLLLATSAVFCDPLFPGYGTGSLLAIRLLGAMRYEQAVPALFSLIGHRDFSVENAVLAALRNIGPAARKFAMDRLSAFPVTAEHERAVMVLIEFLPDQEIDELFSKILADPRVKNTRLEQYLKL